MIKNILRKLPIKTLIVVGLIGFIYIYHQGTYKYVESMFPLEKSENKQASKQFLKAMTYRTYIFHLHPIFDYNSIIMKPFMYMKEFHYKKGKKLLPKDSVEDIFWWTMMNKEIYGLVALKRGDDSMSYDKLDWKEYKKVQEEIYEKIMRYAQGEIYFNADELTGNRYDMLSVLVEEYLNSAVNAYDGNSLLEKTKQNFQDINYAENLKSILSVYEKFSLKFLPISNHYDKKQYSYIENIVLISRDIVINNTMGRGIKFSSSECMTSDISTIINNLPKLISYVEGNDDYLSKVIFKDCLYLDSILMREIIKKRVLISCQPYYPEISNIYKKIKELNDEYK